MSETSPVFIGCEMICINEEAIVELYKTAQEYDVEKPKKIIVCSSEFPRGFMDDNLRRKAEELGVVIIANAASMEDVELKEKLESALL